MLQYQIFQPTTLTIMGIIMRSFLSIAVTTVGIYLVQNYQIPNLIKLADTALVHAKQVEKMKQCKLSTSSWGVAREDMEDAEIESEPCA